MSDILQLSRSFPLCPVPLQILFVKRRGGGLQVRRVDTLNFVAHYLFFQVVHLRSLAAQVPLNPWQRRSFPHAPSSALFPQQRGPGAAQPITPAGAETGAELTRHRQLASAPPAHLVMF